MHLRRRSPSAPALLATAAATVASVVAPSVPAASASAASSAAPAVSHRYGSPRTSSAAPVSPGARTAGAPVASPAAGGSSVSSAAVATPGNRYDTSMPPTSHLAPDTREKHGDRLTVIVSGSGVPGGDGRYRLSCHPTGGGHPTAQAACDRLDQLTTWGRDLFAPVPPDAQCSSQYGGPATAHVTGKWAGRQVDAYFSRRNGCEIARWDRFVPFIPAIER
ncbi:SSI family serine proteinase inhibitor [Streptomyces sp. NPDC003077]|uniref:SSI family serine proteinase inhibitor n=1 Tax=Streptomyces sp. NPDC003077 TaxID=3154443 RepID=UPI0033A51F08